MSQQDLILALALATDISQQDLVYGCQLKPKGLRAKAIALPTVSQLGQRSFGLGGVDWVRTWEQTYTTIGIQSHRN